MEKEKVLVVVLVGLALVERLVWDLGPNVELVTMASVLAGMYLPRRWSFVVPLVVMVVSDAVLGFGAISLFVWSGFVGIWALPGFVEQRMFERKVLVGLCSGVMGAWWFYAWTNFGVWLTEPYGMYSSDLAGLIMSLVNGLPFLRLSMFSSVVFVGLGVGVIETLGMSGIKKKFRWGMNGNS